MITEKLALRKSRMGYYLIILAAAGGALIHVISKPLLESSENSVEINPVVMAFLIYFIAGIFFTPLVRKTHSISKFGKKDWVFMGLIGAAEVLALIAYFYGLPTATAVNASIFSNSEVIFALVIAMLIFRERLRIKECIPFSMIVIGMMVIPIGNDFIQNGYSLGDVVTGDLLIIASGMLYAIDISLCKYLGDRFDIKKVTQILSLICAAVAISIIAIFQIPMDVDLAKLPGIITISIFGTGVSTLFFLIALKMIGTVRTVLLYSTTAIFGVIFSGVFLAETITSMDILSLVLVLTGIYLLRNRLAGRDEETVEDEHGKVPFNGSRRTTSVKRVKHIPNVSDNIKKEIVFQSWIGAG